MYTKSVLRRNPKITIDDVTAKIFLRIILREKISGNIFGCNWNGPRTHLGPWLFWFPRNLVPKKFGPQEIWSHMKIITFHTGTNFLWAQISWDPKFSETKISQRPKWDQGAFQLQPHIHVLFCSTNSTKMDLVSWNAWGSTSVI